MKKNNRTLSTAFAIAALVCAAATAALYYLSMMTGFDVAIGHFRSGASLTAFIVLAFCAIAFSIASGAALTKKCSVIADRKYSKGVSVVFVILGALILAKAALDLPSAFPNIAAAAKTETGVGKEEVLALAAPIFAIAAAVYFIISVGEKKTEKARAYLSFTAIVWSLLFTLSTYFDSDRTINSPIKGILLVVSVANMLFITEDARFLIGTQKTGAYRALCAVCVSVGVAFALPNAICATLGAFGIKTSSVFAAPESIYGALGFDLLGSLISLVIPVAAGVRLLTSSSYLGEYAAPKHEKKAPNPFGEAPKGSSSDFDFVKDDADDAETTDKAEAAEEVKETEAVETEETEAPEAAEAPEESEESEATESSVEEGSADEADDAEEAKEAE